MYIEDLFIIGLIILLLIMLDLRTEGGGDISLILNRYQEAYTSIFSFFSIPMNNLRMNYKV